MKTLNTLKKRGVAVLLAVMMCVGMLNLTVFAANTANNNNTSVADASTADTWENYFTNNGYGEGVDAGFVWSDKSVVVASDPNSFDITYSALGSAEVKSAVDLVLVLDISGSMGDPEGLAANGKVSFGSTEYTIAANSGPRMYYLIKAVNQFMEQFMENPNNRIAIVTYDAVAYELLPLDHYTLMSGHTEYVTAERHHWQRFGGATGTTGQFASSLKTWCIGDELGEQNNYVTSWGNTNLMAGIGAGMDILNNVQDTTLEVNGQIITRNPVMVVMTDGEANAYVTTSDGSTPVTSATIEYVAAESGKIYLRTTGDGADATLNPTFSDAIRANRVNKTEGSLITENDLSTVYGVKQNLKVYAPSNYHYYTGNSGATQNVWEYTLAYANKWKDAVAKSYDMQPKIFTIGYDINTASTNLGYQIINPLGTGVNNPYNDGYFDAKSDNTGTPIDKVFEAVYKEVSAVPANYPAGTLTYTDELGDFMEMGNAIDITVFGKTVTATRSGENWTVTNQNVTNSFNQTVDLASAISIKVDTNSGRQVLTITVNPEALPVYTWTENAGSNGAVPITFTYNVSLAGNVLDKDGNINASVINAVDDTFINNHSDGDGCQRQSEIVRKRRRNFVVFRREWDNKIKCFLAQIGYLQFAVSGA